MQPHVFVGPLLDLTFQSDTHSTLNAKKAKALGPSAILGENEYSKGQVKQLSALKLDKFCICAFDFLYSVKQRFDKNHQSKTSNCKVLEYISKNLKLEIRASNCIARGDWLQSQLASIYQNKVFFWPGTSVFWNIYGRRSLRQSIIGKSQVNRLKEIKPQSSRVEGKFQVV